MKISPSLMCMDLLKFKEQIEFIDQHADYFHIDIMDGHFVPNLTLSPFFVGREEARHQTTGLSPDGDSPAGLHKPAGAGRSRLHHTAPGDHQRSGFPPD